MRFSLVLLLSVFSHGSQGSEEVLSGSRSKKNLFTQDLAPMQNLRQKLKALPTVNTTSAVCEVVEQLNDWNQNALTNVIQGLTYYQWNNSNISWNAATPSIVFGAAEGISDVAFGVADAIAATSQFALVTFQDIAVALPIATADVALGCKSTKVKLALVYPAVFMIMKQLGIKPSDLPSDFVKQLSDAFGKMNENQSKNHMADHKKR